MAIKLTEELSALLIKDGIVDERTILLAKEQLKSDNEKRLDEVLEEMQVVPTDTINMYLSKIFHTPALNPLSHKIEPKVLELIQERNCREKQMIPVKLENGELSLVMENPLDNEAISIAEFCSRKNIRIFVSTRLSIREAIDRNYSRHSSMSEMMDIVGESGLEIVEEKEEVDLSKLQQMSEDAPTIRVVNLIFMEAVKRGASDIHIEPFEKELRIRYRIDGILHKIPAPPLAMYPAISSRIKIMSKLDIAEKRLPQDGRIMLRMGDVSIDVRVSILPDIYGEKIVMRLLNTENVALNLRTLGFEDKYYEMFIDALNKPYGMVLVTGPTGSGKTTTLYAGLNEINSLEKNITTVEDPVEYKLNGINAVHVRSDIGLTFAAALRSILRQDPDIVMVGEIRDVETAEIAIRAALTGHLVLSTLHTNDATSAVTRLTDMGIEPFLITASVHLTQAQRLVRKICPECKEAYIGDREALLKTGARNVPEGSITLFRGKGCDACGGTGFKGRTTIYEMMKPTDEIKRLVLEKASPHQIRELARREGMRTMIECGIDRALKGETTIDEVMRVSLSEE